MISLFDNMQKISCIIVNPVWKDCVVDSCYSSTSFYPYICYGRNNLYCVRNDKIQTERIFHKSWFCFITICHREWCCHEDYSPVQGKLTYLQLSLSWQFECNQQPSLHGQEKQEDKVDWQKCIAEIKLNINQRIEYLERNHVW